MSQSGPSRAAACRTRWARRLTPRRYSPPADERDPCRRFVDDALVGGREAGGAHHDRLAGCDRFGEVGLECLRGGEVDEDVRFAPTDGDIPARRGRLGDRPPMRPRAPRGRCPSLPCRPFHVMLHAGADEHPQHLHPHRAGISAGKRPSPPPRTGWPLGRPSRRADMPLPSPNPNVRFDHCGHSAPNGAASAKRPIRTFKPATGLPMRTTRCRPARSPFPAPPFLFTIRAGTPLSHPLSVVKPTPIPAENADALPTRAVVRPRFQQICPRKRRSLPTRRSDRWTTGWGCPSRGQAQRLVRAAGYRGDSLRRDRTIALPGLKSVAARLQRRNSREQSSCRARGCHQRRPSRLRGWRRLRRRRACDIADPYVAASAADSDLVRGGCRSLGADRGGAGKGGARPFADAVLLTPAALASLRQPLRNPLLRPTGRPTPECRRR
jgi:hypothetical protein